MSSQRLLPWALLWLALLSGCNISSQESGHMAVGSMAGAARPSELAGSRWVVDQVDGAQVLSSTRITVNFLPDRATGFDGCNWFGGMYAKATRFGFLGVESTLVGCPEPVLQQSKRLATALLETRSATRHGNHLTLLDAAGQARVELSSQATHGPQQKNLTNTRWLQKTVNGAPVSGRPVQLDFGTDTFALSIGCGRQSGRYLVQHDRLVFPRTAMDYRACPGGSGGHGVDYAALRNIEALESPEAAYVEGDLLTIDGVNHKEAVFERCASCAPLEGSSR